jgi:hypothetical protein
MNREITHVQARQLRVGDVLVNPAGSEFTITKVAPIGRGYRVHYLRSGGEAGAFTAAPEAITRVGVPRPHDRLAATA